MSHIENADLKRRVIQYQQVLGNTPYVDDSLLRGGYRVVRTIAERDAIAKCYRKYGMKVVVVGTLQEGLFREYILNSKHLTNIWKEVIIEPGIVSVDETLVDLVEDYSELEEDLITQRDLNLVLKGLILNLQFEIDNLDIPTNTSELVNDGEDGLNKFITALDIPAQTPQVKSDWNAVSGPEEILNKPTIPVVVPQEQSDWDAVSGVSFIKNKPTIPAPVDISGKLDKPLTPNNVPTRVILGDGSTKNLSDISLDNSSLVDKMHSYWDATLGKFISSGLKFIAGVIPTLEFSGRIKSDGLLINETTNAILPQEIKFKDGRFKGALANGIERSFLLEGGNGFDFDSLVDTYFTDNAGYAKPTFATGTNYQSTHQDRNGLRQLGATQVNQDNFLCVIKYTSNGATLGRQNGAWYFFVTTNYPSPSTGSWSFFRQFEIQTTLSTQRVFVGASLNFANPGAEPSNVAISSLTNCLGICMESGNPNILFAHNDATGSATIIDSGIVNNASNIYGLYMSQNYNESDISIKLSIFNKSTGVISWWYYTVTSDYAGTYYYALIWCVDSLGVSPVVVVDYGLIRTTRRKYL